MDKVYTYREVPFYLDEDRLKAFGEKKVAETCKFLYGLRINY